MNIKIWEESANMYKNRVPFLKKFVSQDVLRVFARTFVEPYTRISGGECGIWYSSTSICWNTGH